MSRAIITKAAAVRDGKQSDSVSDVLLKLLPAETTGAYLAIVGATHDVVNEKTEYWVAGAAVVLLLLTPIYMWCAGKVRNLLHLAATMVGFGIWAMGIGWPLQQLIGYKMWQMAIIVALYGVVMAIVAAAVANKGVT